MNTKILLFSLLVTFSHLSFAADFPHTPERGSAERQAICDGARAYVIEEYVSPTKLPQPLVFKIERIEVIDGYCSFEAIPVFKDGSSVGTEYYFMDIAFNLCLKRTNDKWHVIYDFSRTDVPDATELKQIWRSFPKEFPFALLSKFWRDNLDRVK